MLYEVITSYIEWHAGTHNGLIQFKQGEFQIKKNRIRKGLFVLDLRTLSNTDVSNIQIRDMLVSHLKSPVYFDVEKYPFGYLSIDTSDFFDGDDKPIPVKGIITLKNSSREIA